MTEKGCPKCGLIQLFDDIWGFCICDSKEALLYGCPPIDIVREIRPEWKYDVTAIMPKPPVWSYRRHIEELTQEEQMCLDKLKKPIFTFDDVQKAMDEKAQELGYEDHNDFLTKTGWFNRFDKDIQ